MKKMIMILFLLAGIILTVSCGGDKHINRAAIADADLEEELQTLEEIRNALTGLGINVDFTESSISAMPPEDNNSPGYAAYAAYKEKFEQVPIEMFLLGENEYKKLDKFVGNYYFCYGLVPEWVDSEGDFECMDFFLMADMSK